VGECAEHQGVVYGLVAPIFEQAKVCADALLERGAPAYAGSVPSAKLKVMGVDVVSIGTVTGEREAIAADAPAGIYRKLIVDGGVAVGAILLGDTRGAESLLDAVSRGETVGDPLGRLVQAAEATAADLPPDAQVCNCHGVSKGAISAAVLELGCTSSREVITCTRAGTGCGSCKPLVAEIVSFELGGAAEEPHYLCACRRQTRTDLAETIRAEGYEAVSEVAAACGTGRDCGACKPALAYLVSEVNETRHREERDARFINDRVHANIQRDGTFSVVPQIAGGVATSDQLRRLADVADRYEIPMIKLTGGQRVDLVGVRKEDLPAVWRELDMPSGHAYGKSFRTVKTCVGSDFCRFGLGDSTGLGIRIERRFAGLESPGKLKLAVAGCPRNCSEAMVKDVGWVAVGDGRWEMYVGGAAGAHVRKGDLLCTVDDPDAALLLTGRFIQHYRENARWLERTYAFMERVGVDEVRAVVVEDRDGDGERLDAELERSLAAYRDPWLEGREPVVAHQFQSVVRGA
jgi:nitrite reductase (NADH) large subunit